MRSDLVNGLRSQGLDVVSASEAGMSGREDPDQLALAASQGRVLVTFNIRHFRVIHARWMAEGRSHAGIVLGHQQRWVVREHIRKLVRLAASVTAEEMQNREELLGRW